MGSNERTPDDQLTHCAVQADREQRLMAAKRQTPGEFSRKRRLIDDDDDFDTQLSDDDPDEAPQPQASKQAPKKNFILDDDESE